jgi:hypothetical protein
MLAELHEGLVVDPYSNHSVVSSRDDSRAASPMNSLREPPPEAHMQLTAEAASNVTRNIIDILDRLHEAPAAIYRILDGEPNKPRAAEPNWTAARRTPGPAASMELVNPGPAPLPCSGGGLHRPLRRC